MTADGPLSAAMFAALEGAEPTAHAQPEDGAAAAGGSRVEVAEAARARGDSGSSSAGSAAAVSTVAAVAREEVAEEEAAATAAAVAVAGAAGGRGEPHVVVIPLGDLAAAAELGAGDLLSHSVRTTDV